MFNIKKVFLMILVGCSLSTLSAQDYYQFMQINPKNSTETSADYHERLEEMYHAQKLESDEQDIKWVYSKRFNYPVKGFSIFYGAQEHYFINNPRKLNESTQNWLNRLEEIRAQSEQEEQNLLDLQYQQTEDRIRFRNNLKKASKVFGSLAVVGIVAWLYVKKYSKATKDEANQGTLDTKQ